MLEHECVDGNWRALSGPVAIVQVIEASAQALVEDVGGTQRKRAIAANGETGGEDSAGLGRGVKLELVVCSDVPSTALGVRKDPIGESERKRRIAGTCNHDGPT